MESYRISGFVPDNQLPEGIMFCPECKHQNPKENRFCGMCGARLRWANAESYTPDVAPEPSSPLVTLPEEFGGTSRESGLDELPLHERPLHYGEYTDALLADLSGQDQDDSPYPEPQRQEDHLSRTSFEEEALNEEPLNAKAMADVWEHAPEDTPKEEKQPLPSLAIGGPSFLGLGYSYDDEAEGSRRGWIPALVALAIMGVIAVLLAQNWHGSRDWAVTRSALLAQTIQDWRSAPPPAPEAVQENPASGANTAANSASRGDSENPEAGSVEAPAEPPSSDSVAAEASGSGGSEAQAGEGPAITINQGQNLELEQASKPPAQAGKPPEKAAADKGIAAEAARSEVASSVSRKKAPEAEKGAAEEKAGEDLVAQGERFLYGQGVRRDCNQAVVYFRAGAEQQNARALTRMGALYATGTCVPLDRVMAYNWFSRALAHDGSNPSLEENLDMLWRDMNSSERQQVLEPRRR